MGTLNPLDPRNLLPPMPCHMPFLSFLGGAPPPGGEAPSNVDLVMLLRECIHPKP